MPTLRFDAPLTLPAVIIYMASTVCADFILTVTILYCLFQSKTGWDYTDKVSSPSTLPLTRPRSSCASCA